MYLRVSIRPPRVGSSFQEKLLEAGKHVKTDTGQIPVLDASFTTAGNFEEEAKAKPKVSNNKY